MSDVVRSTDSPASDDQCRAEIAQIFLEIEALHQRSSATQREIERLRGDSDQFRQESARLRAEGHLTEEEITERLRRMEASLVGMEAAA